MLGSTLLLAAPGTTQDIITDFIAGAGSDDVIEFHDGLFADAAAVLGAATASGNDTIITVDASNTIKLLNVSPSSLHPDDFHVV